MRENLSRFESRERGLILKRCLLQAKKDWGEVGEAWAEGDYEAHQSQAIQAKLPLDVPARRHRRTRTAVAEGFSLHADLRC